MEHAMRCIARLIRLLLGPTAVAEKKLACGKSLGILGVRHLTCSFDSLQARARTQSHKSVRYVCVRWM